MEIPVRFRQLSLLDDRRSPEERITLRLNLDLTLGATATEEHRFQPAFEIPASSWLELLASVKHRDVATFDVTVGGLALPPGLAPAAETYRQALAALQALNLDHAVVKCRETIDRLEAAIPQFAAPPRSDWDNRDAREGWSISQRVGFVRKAVEHFHHPAAHGGVYSIETARLAVSLTGMLLRFYVSAAEGLP